MGVQHDDIDHSGITGVGGAMTVEDEGTPLATAATTLDFVGAGVTASGTGAEKTITIPGDASGTIQTWTPTWTASSSNPTIGDGSITGHYQLIAAKLYWVQIAIVYGSTTNAGSGSYTISNFPFTVKATPPIYQTLTFYLRDAGTTNYIGLARLSQNSTTTDTIFVAETAGAKAWSASVPVTPANGDTVIITGILAST